MIGQSLTVDTYSGAGINIWASQTGDTFIKAILGKHGELRIQEVEADFSPGDKPAVIHEHAIYAKNDWIRVRITASQFQEEILDN